jgi:hypothetical protein
MFKYKQRYKNTNVLRIYSLHVLHGPAGTVSLLKISRVSLLLVLTLRNFYEQKKSVLNLFLSPT